MSHSQPHINYICKGIKHGIRCGNVLTQITEFGLCCGDGYITSKTPITCTKCGHINVWRPDSVHLASNFSKDLKKISLNT